MEQTQEKMQSILAHLAALRNMLIKSAIAVLAAFVVIFYAFTDPLIQWITQPITAKGIEIIYTAMSEALMTKLKVALIASIVAASPVVFWQIWQFIRPALYPHEKKAIRMVFCIAVFLFLLGIVFCYCAVYMLAVDFFLISGQNLASPMLSIDKYVSFLFGFILPFGIAFELPVALYLTTRMGITNYKMLTGMRKFMILAVVVIAAILTPPDVVSQIMLAIPILILFEISLLIVKRVNPRKTED